MKKILPYCLFFLWACPAFTQLYVQGNGTETVCTGTFYDSGASSGNYSDGEYSIRTFQGAGGANISIQFTSFFLEYYKDFLLIYDGSDINAPLLGTFTGNISPGTITSTSGSLTFEFISDFNTAYAGWAANISCVSTNCLPNMANCQDSLCFGSFFDSGGFGGNYGNNENLTHTLFSSTGSCLEMNFTAFTLENNQDFLFIYDGTSSNAPLIGIYTGTTSPGIVTSTSDALTLVFTSDAQINYPGWTATVACVACPPVIVNPTSSCLPNIGNCVDTTCGGFFYDSGGPAGNYGNNESFKHTIVGDLGGCFSVQFTDFDLEPGMDYLEIYDGPNTAYPLIGVYTGTNSPRRVQSNTGSLTFSFSSNSAGTRAGWKAQINCSNVSSATSIPSGSATKAYDSYHDSPFSLPRPILPILFENQSFTLPPTCGNEYSRQFKVRLLSNPNTAPDSFSINKIAILFTRGLPYPSWIKLSSAGWNFPPLYYEPQGSVSPYKIEADFKSFGIQRVWNSQTQAPYEVLTVEITPVPSADPNFNSNNWNGFANRVQILHGIVIVDNLDSVLEEIEEEDPGDGGVADPTAPYTLYPNPCQEMIYLEAPRSDAKQPDPRVQMYAVDGKNIEGEVSLEGDKFRIDTEKLPAGIYFLKIIEANGTISGLRFVKQ